ncbi:MAG: tyrosine-type recombinase/integrase [Deltaproteobacteria bacterium]|nr:tyrosine-type recombinase/integrase [Deltaproteobacteria bacterium]
MAWVSPRYLYGNLVGYYYYWKEKKNGKWITLRESLKTKNREEAYHRAYNEQSPFVTKRQRQQRLRFEEFKDKYLFKLLPSENKSRLTQAKYEISLNHFQGFISKKYHIEFLDDIQRFHIEEYRIKRVDDKVSPSTISGELKTIKAFFNRALDFDYVKVNPVRKIKIPRGKPRVEIFNPLEIESMIKESKKDKQLNAVILFLLQTGVREEGTIKAKWINLNEDKRTLKTIWKGGGEKVVFLSKLTFNAIKRLPQLNEYVFPNPHSSEIKYWAKLARDIREFCKGLDIKGNLHKFRHTYASYSLACGMPLQTLRDKLGHYSVAETDKYSHVINESLNGKMKQIFGYWNR